MRAQLLGRDMRHSFSIGMEGFANELGDREVVLALVVIQLNDVVLGGRRCRILKFFATF